MSNFPKYIFLAVFSCSFLVACNEFFDDKNNTSAASNIINGISVPLPPDPVVNNATLAGVDSNLNGVRDDIEREIASNYPSSYTGAMARAKTMQSQILGDAVDLDSYRLAFCSAATGSYDANGLYSMILNTEPRFDAYLKNTKPTKMPECK